MSVENFKIENKFLNIKIGKCCKNKNERKTLEKIILRISKCVI